MAQAYLADRKLRKDRLEKLEERIEPKVVVADSLSVDLTTKPKVLTRRRSHSDSEDEPPSSQSLFVDDNANNDDEDYVNLAVKKTKNDKQGSGASSSSEDKAVRRATQIAEAFKAQHRDTIKKFCEFFQTVHQLSPDGVKRVEESFSNNVLHGVLRQQQRAHQEGEEGEDEEGSEKTPEGSQHRQGGEQDESGRVEGSGKDSRPDQSATDDIQDSQAILDDDDDGGDEVDEVDGGGGGA